MNKFHVYHQALLTGFLCAIIAGNAAAQCPLSAFQAAVAGAPPCGTFAQDLVGSGTYSTIDVISGADYTFSTCGTSFDTQISGYTTIGAPLFYNDNDGPDCIGINASVNWTANLTGSIRIMVNRSDCQEHDFSGISAVLKYRQNDNISFSFQPTICADDGVITLNATPAGGTFGGPGVSGNNFDPIAAGSGTHALSYTFGACTKSNSITVGGAVLNIASQKNPTCNGSFNGEIDITANGGIPPYSYLWSNGATTEDLVNVPAGNYEVTVTDNYNCVSTISTVLSDPPALGVAISGTNATCNNSNDGTATATVAGGTAPYNYFWSNFSFDENLTGIPAGTYTVLVTDTFGCTANGSIEITQGETIVVTAAAANPSCGDDDASIAVTVSGGLLPYSFLWNNGDTTQNLNNIPSGNYTVTVTDAANCSESAFVVVAEIQDSLVVSFIKIVSVCVGSPIYLVNTSTASSSAELFYFWDFGDGTSSTLEDPFHIYDTPGDYDITLRVLTNHGCVGTMINSIEVHALPDATISVSPDLEICTDENATLTAPADMIDYLWSQGSTTQSISVFQQNFYSVTVTDANGCSNSSTVFITVFPLPVVSISSDTFVSRGFSVQLEASAPGAVSFSWSPTVSLDDPNSSSPFAAPQQTTQYTVIVTDENGCTDAASVIVSVLDDYFLIIPNLITPNGNGQNDTWNVKNIATYENETHIFNKWGSLVFSSRNYQNNWDGTKDGNPLTDGTYYYVIDLENGKKVYKGAVSILR